MLRKFRTAEFYWSRNLSLVKWFGLSS